MTRLVFRMNQPENILVVLPSPMGDAIMAGGALRKIRETFVGSRITFFGNGTVRDILAGNPWSNDFVEWDKERSFFAHAKELRRRDFDTAILLTNSFRSAALVRWAGIEHRIGYGRDGRSFLLTCSVPVFRLAGKIVPLSMLGYYSRLVDYAAKYFSDRRVCEGGVGGMELFSSDLDKNQTDELFVRWGIDSGRHLVVMVPGGVFGPSKIWAGERFAQVVDMLIEKNNCQVILSCSPTPIERRISENIAVAMKHKAFTLTDENVSLRMLKEIIRRCDLMIGNDTGPCHIAASFGVALVTIFGSTDPRWTATGYDGERRLRVNVDCGPCQQKECAGEHYCMDAISVDDVYSAAVEQLNGSAEKVSLGSYYDVYSDRKSVV